jgi:voltage-gated potassium channel
MMAGIGMLALFAGILTNGFAQEIQRRDFLRTWELVARLPLFQSLGAFTIAEITKLLRAERVAAGRTVMRKGQPGDCMYFIASGEVEIGIRPAPIRCREGHFFGELALITGEPRSATVVTTMPTTLLRLDVADFRGLAATQPDLLQAIKTRQQPAARSANGEEQ